MNSKSSQKRPRYTLEFKKFAVDRVRSGEDLQTVAADLGFSPGLYSKWKHQVGGNGKNGKNGSAPISASEAADLKKQVADLQAENLRLKAKFGEIYLQSLEA